MAFDRAAYERDSDDLARALANYRQKESDLAAARAWLIDAERRCSVHWRERVNDAERRATT